ncbi:hypothetical protein RJ639_028584 [Escallonia herrerae]|uniref:Neutral ceramidase n=1 Tax=Escallonia herrerae TaxID=1293975 RepID=A0AA88X2S2_9ASTE|nr:hypothetical protein RJ639_028584 [Escallonia herrerae]
MSSTTAPRLPLCSLVLALFGCIFIAVISANGEYLIGVGSYDMTGPAAGVNMMGYGNLEQNTAGIHFRLRARAFIVAESSDGARFAFVNLDAGMASQLVTIKVLERLKKRYGKVYNEDNVAISGTHTYAGPRGYLHIVQAHDSLKPGSVFINTGINRSPSAYLFNPPEERARYPRDVDMLMTLLKFVDGKTGESIGAFSWFATHGTSMSKDNKLISGDNKVAAARFFEDCFTSTFKKTSTTINHSTKTSKKAQTIKATGGQTCSKTASQGFKVRKNDGSLFVGAFCQSNVGDVSPNVLGAFCTDSGLPCDFNHSSCHGNDLLCVGRGPGTNIIGERQFQKAVNLFTTAKEELSGKIDYQHVYLNFTDIEIGLGGNKVVKTCPAALGPGFAAGTTDGPVLSVFNKINDFWKRVRDFLKKPTRYQVACQQPKAVLLDTACNSSDSNAQVGKADHTIRTRRLLQHSGPHTLSAYIQEFNKLAKAMAQGENIVPKGPSPPDLSSVQLKLLLDPFGDSPPPGVNFGDVKQDIHPPKGGSFNKGNRASATFWSPTPRYDLLTEGTYAVVEMLQRERWIPAYDDDDFSLFFKWGVDNSTFYGSATIEWELPEDASPGVYRLRHFGSTKKTKDSPNTYFTGASSAFTVS